MGDEDAYLEEADAYGQDAYEQTMGNEDAYLEGGADAYYGQDALQEQAASNHDADVPQTPTTGTTNKSSIPRGGGERRGGAPDRKLFLLTLASNLFFVVAAALYLRMAVLSVQFAKTYGRGGTVRNQSGNVIEYDLLNWDQLSDAARAAASDLGYTQQLWDGDTEPSEIDSWWECLSPDQIEAAEVLGYDQQKWDGGSVPANDIVCDEDVVGSEEEVDGGGEVEDEAEYVAEDNIMDAEAAPDEEETSVNYNDMAWSELPPEAMDAAEALGYTQQLWDDGGTPKESDEWWDELSSAQQEAARTLGYDKASWDGSGRRSRLLRKLDGAEYSASENPFADDDKRYRNLYISASVFFVVVGMLDWFATRPKLYPALFVVAGLFGFLSALYVTENVRNSNILNCVSVHFFSWEAFAIAWHREQNYHIALVLADVAFGLGSIIEVVLSYFYIFDEWADYDMEVAAFDATAQSLWVICSIIYTIFTLKSWPAGFINAPAQSKTEGADMNGKEQPSDHANEAWGDEPLEETEMNGNERPLDHANEAWGDDNDYISP